MRGNRRQWIAQLVASAGTLVQSSRSWAQANPPSFASVRPDPSLRFPRDHGAHPDFRVEWWYITAWLRDAAQAARPWHEDGFGLQITFFRLASQHARDNPSRFAPTQLLFAHAALALPNEPRLLHAQRAARAGMGLATVAEHDTDVRIGDWSLRRESNDHYHSQLNSDRFGVDLKFAASSPPVLQGEQGFSRKGPEPEQASYYYSRPWLAVTGNVVIAARSTAKRAKAMSLPVSGDAWFDHEWSSQVLDANASGWDWVGLHFDNGASLMAFRIRHKNGSDLWREARWTTGEDRRTVPVPTPARPRFTPLRQWQSPRTGAYWPVEMRLDIDERSLVLKPILDDQELDSRQSTGIVYWEGAVRVIESGKPVGRGYLELTGYHRPLRL